jgi:amidohydrolase
MKEHQYKNIVEDIYETLVSIRTHLHQNPELSFQEFKTAEFIRNKLDSFGLEWKEIANTGTVVVINPNNISKGCIALRADIDALPINEENNCEYKSLNEGIMHACGHDVHTTILLGVAEILAKNKNSIDKCVKLIFQPGEERLPGGASILIKEGVLDNPKVDKIVGLHVFPDMEYGHLGFKEGMYMASCDELHVKITGKGGHGALPQKVKDPVIAGAELISSLQRIISRSANPSTPTVLSFGRFIAEGSTNVIPQEVNLEGTFRTLNEKWRFEAHRLMLETKKGIEQAHQVEIDFDIRVGYPFLANDINFTNDTKNKISKEIGSKFVHDLEIRMTAEDFSYYSQKVPACFFRLGVANEERGINYGVHHPKFDIDHRSLITGVSAMLAAIDFKYE